MVDGRLGDVQAGRDLRFGVAVGKQEEGGFLLGSKGLEGGFEVELGDELLFLFVSEALPHLKLGGAEWLSALLDLVQIEVAKALAQRRIPGRDPSRLRMDKQKRPKSQRI